MARIDREQLGELLSGYIDGELDARERQIIERVLSEDESARQLLADLQRTAQAVSSLPRHAAPASILVDTQATLERSALLDDFPEPRAHQTRGRTSWAARLAMAAMVGLVVVTGWWFTTEQTRRGSQGRTELAKREVGESAPILVPTTIALNAARNAGAAVATVEQQLASGVDPVAFRSQTFAAEPVRLQVTVRDRAEREAVSMRIAASLSSQHLADLASVPNPRADTTGSVQNFYYRGKTGLNFEAADEDQILVRASPQQIDRLLTELSQPNQPEEGVVLVAGPLNVHGVEKSRSVVQLLGEQQQPGVSRKGTTRGDGLSFDENSPIAEADRASVDKSAARNGGLVGGLLKIVGIDPKLLSSGAKPAEDAKSAAEPGVPPAESTAVAASRDTSEYAADESSVSDAEKSAKSDRVEAKKKATATSAVDGPRQPSAPSPLVERRLREVAASGRGLVGKGGRDVGGEESPAANITVVVQIIEQPTPAPPTKPVRQNLNRNDRSKTAE